jgi:hypothetical protein
MSGHVTNTGYTRYGNKILNAKPQEQRLLGSHKDCVPKQAITTQHNAEGTVHSPWSGCSTAQAAVNVAMDLTVARFADKFSDWCLVKGQQTPYSTDITRRSRCFPSYLFNLEIQRGDPLQRPKICCGCNTFTERANYTKYSAVLLLQMIPLDRYRQSLKREEPIFVTFSEQRPCTATFCFHILPTDVRD